MSQHSRLQKKLHFSLVFAVSVFLLSACTKDAKGSDYQAGDLVSTSVDSIKIEIELAISQQQKSKGLMFRREMPENQGMLFIFKDAGQRSFWMKNTYLPLDIAYIDPNGIIKEIHRMYPNNQNSVPSHSQQIQFALEMNQGWFKSNNLKPGSKLDMNPLLKILKMHKIQVLEQ